MIINWRIEHHKVLQKIEFEQKKKKKLDREKCGHMRFALLIIMIHPISPNFSYNVKTMLRF